MENKFTDDCLFLSVESKFNKKDTEFRSNINIKKKSTALMESNKEQELEDTLLLFLMTCDALISSRYKILKENNADFQMLETERKVINKFFEDIVERNQKKFFPETYPTAPDWVREYLASAKKEIKDNK